MNLSSLFTSYNTLVHVSLKLLSELMEHEKRKEKIWKMKRAVMREMKEIILSMNAQGWLL